MVTSVFINNDCPSASVSPDQSNFVSGYEYHVEGISLNLKFYLRYFHSKYVSSTISIDILVDI